MKRGFTLIELLVVIAIIGILAGIVIGALGGSRTAAQDTKVKGQLHGVRQQAEIVYGDSGNSYGTADPSTGNCPDEPGTLENDTKIQELLSTLPAGTIIKCGVTAPYAAYAVAASLADSATTNQFWCVDSTGYEGAITITTPSDIIDASHDSCALINALN